MRVLRAVNSYFIPTVDNDDKPHWSDYAWLYGGYGGVVVVAFGLLVSKLYLFIN